MTARGFDPRRSAALRDELARRAEAQGRPAPAAPPPRARRQLVVAGVVGAVLVVGTIGVLQQVPSRTPAGGASPVPTTSEPGAVDPRTVPASPDSGIRMPGVPLLRATGNGARAFTVDVPAGVPAVQVYLTCPQGTAYTVTGLTSVDGTCGADPALVVLPVRQGPSDFRVEVPDGTAYSVVVLRAPIGGSTFKTPPIQAPSDR